MTADVLGLVASLVVLAVAGDQFVVGVARLASAFQVRATVVGAVVGGFGTSLPELIVAGVAAARGEPQLAVGSAVGSIVANVSLALAVAALVTPVRVDSLTVRREAPISTGAVLLFAVVAAGGLSRLEGVLLTVALAGALVGLLLNAGTGAPSDELAVETRDFFGTRRPQGVGREAGRSLLSVLAMVGGAELMVRSASGISERVGLSEGFVGLTLVAVGTSAPLIATAIQAARRGDHDLVVGIVLGGNLFIALAGGAIVAFTADSPAGVGLLPLVLMAAVTVAAWAFMARDSRVQRSEATVLLVAYLATLPFLSR